jgi:hypothetical protein
MFSKISVIDQLNTERSKNNFQVSASGFESERIPVFGSPQNQNTKTKIQAVLKKKNCSGINHFDFDKLETNKIYHISTIKKICWKYNLRFLPSGYFVGDLPAEAYEKLEQLENSGTFDFENLQIIAPSKLFELEDANADPLLMAPMGNGYYYLIHKWGGDLSWYRAVLAYPFRDFLSLFKSLLLAVVLVCAIVPNSILTTHPDISYFNIYRLLLIPYLTIMFGGFLAFASFAFNKNFSDTVWDAKTYN